MLSHILFYTTLFVFFKRPLIINIEIWKLTILKSSFDRFLPCPNPWTWLRIGLSGTGFNFREQDKDKMSMIPYKTTGN